MSFDTVNGEVGADEYRDEDESLAVDNVRFIVGVDVDSFSMACCCWPCSIAFMSKPLSKPLENNKTIMSNKNNV